MLIGVPIQNKHLYKFEISIRHTRNCRYLARSPIEMKIGRTARMVKESNFGIRVFFCVEFKMKGQYTKKSPRRRGFERVAVEAECRNEK